MFSHVVCVLDYVWGVLSSRKVGNSHRRDRPPLGWMCVLELLVCVCVYIWIKSFVIAIIKRVMKRTITTKVRWWTPP